MFWCNPERYRLRECWKLSPIEPKADSFAGLMTFGRRRGTAFHELRDGLYNGKPQAEILEDLKARSLGERAIEAARKMADKVAEQYPNETYAAHEVLFEHPIPDSPHVMVGRLDHVLRNEEEDIVGDWKTSKRRTKADFSALAAKYVGSPQVGFYLLGARTLGFNCRRFLYRLVQAPRSSGSGGVEISEFFTTRTSLELKQLERSVHQTCELILFLKNTFGTESHWPVLYEGFDRGYASMLGQKCYEGFMPDGFEEKVEHLENYNDDEEETDEA